MSGFHSFTALCNHLVRSLHRSVNTSALAGVSLAGALAPLSSAQTFYGPIPYLSLADSPFDTADPGFVVETFEDGLFNVTGVSSIGGVQVVLPGPITDSVDADDGTIDGFGTAGHTYFGNGATGITFVFDPIALGGLPTQVGIVWTDGFGTTLFEAFAEDDSLLGTVGPVAIANNSITGETDDDHFFGVEHAAGIARIRISNTAGGIEVDHLQFLAAGGCADSPDLDGDGQVDGADLGLLLSGWGQCLRGCCVGDLNGDGVVDGADLGALLGAWTG